MSKFSKSKFAVILLGALASGANAQGQDFNENKITKTDSLSIIKDSKLDNKSPQIVRGVKEAVFTKKESGKNVIVKTDNFSVLGNKSPQIVRGAEEAVFTKKDSGKNVIVKTDNFSILGKAVAGTVLVCNEFLGVISGKLWYKGKFSIANATKLMLNGKQKKQTNTNNNKNKYNQGPKVNDKELDKPKTNISKHPIANFSNKLKKIDNSSVKSLIDYIIKVLNSFDKLPEILSEKSEWVQEINQDGNKFGNDKLWKQVEEYVASQQLECLSRIKDYYYVPGKSVVLLLVERLRRDLDNYKPNDNDPNKPGSNSVTIKRLCADHCYCILINNNQFGEEFNLLVHEDGSIKVNSTDKGGLTYNFTLLPKEN